MVPAQAVAAVRSAAASWSRVRSAAMGRTFGAKSPKYTWSASSRSLHRLWQVPSGCVQPGLGDSPAVGVLRQTCRVAELTRQLQVVGCGGQVVAFVRDAAEADVHVGGSARHRERVVGCEAQRVLVGPHGVGESALGDADVGQGDGAAQHVGDVPGPA